MSSARGRPCRPAPAASTRSWTRSGSNQPHVEWRAPLCRAAAMPRTRCATCRASRMSTGVHALSHMFREASSARRPRGMPAGCSGRRQIGPQTRLKAGDRRCTHGLATPRVRGGALDEAPLEPDLFVHIQNKKLRTHFSVRNDRKCPPASKAAEEITCHQTPIGRGVVTCAPTPNLVHFMLWDRNGPPPPRPPPPGTPSSCLEARRNGAWTHKTATHD